ncbi:MAG TPA: hypothetical protein VE820_05925 [Sphingomicrobium sp.]|nr:hypothetical protein [Sphingomicrobium sp.]
MASRNIDKFGLELADEHAARREAVRGARSIWSEQVLVAKLRINERIEVTDETGAIIFVAALRDLVKAE